MSKKFCFRRPCDKQYGKRFQTLLKSARQHFYHTYWSISKKVSWKKSLLVICKILWLFLNTLTVNGMYSLLDCDKLTQSIQMPLYEKQKALSDFFFFFFFFFAFLKFRSKFKHLEIKMTLMYVKIFLLASSVFIIQ